MLPQPRRRWALFPRSIIAEHENPVAYLFRAVGRNLAARGDDARFYEQRGNPWMRNMLISRGATALREFQSSFPEIDYVTYDHRHGQDLADWLSLVLATVDIVLIDAAAPPTIVQWTGELTRPHLHTFLLEPESFAGRSEVDADIVRQFRGVCIGSRAAADEIELDAHQYVIRYGAANSRPGRNGQSARHLHETAESLVVQVVRAVDESLIRHQQAEQQSDSTQE